jgi:hypothetical protein
MWDNRDQKPGLTVSTALEFENLMRLIGGTDLIGHAETEMMESKHGANHAIKIHDPLHPPWRS